MNQEKMQNVLLGVLMVGLVLVGGGMYLFSTQLQSVATSVKGIQGSVAQLQAVKPVVTTSVATPLATEPLVSSSAISAFPLSFNYPKDWYLSRYLTEMDLSEGLRLTS